MSLDYEQNDFEGFELDTVERRGSGPGGMPVGPGGINLQVTHLLRESGWPLTRLAYTKPAQYRDDVRIYYGKWPAKLDDKDYFKEIVAVGDDTGFWASGIQIAREFVLTAGHVHAMGGRERVSVKPELDPSELCVRAKRTGALGDSEYQVERSVRHPGFWNEPFFTHDLALLKLRKRGTRLDRQFATAKEFFEAEIGLLVGYGGADACGCGDYGERQYTEYGRRKVVPIPILHEWTIARERYFHRYWGYEPDYEFIASSPLRAADACIGDSGAGLYVPVCPTGSGTVYLDPEKPRFFVCRHGERTKTKEKAGDQSKGGKESARKKKNGRERDEEPEEDTVHEVEFKLAGMVSRQFGLGGSRCGAGSIYVKLFWGPKEDGIGGSGDQNREVTTVGQASGRYREDLIEDDGAEYYEDCVEAMKRYLSSDESSEDELSEKCPPCGYRRRRPKSDR